MINPISISNGFGYRLYDDRNKTMRIVREVNPSGIELVFITPEMLDQFHIDKDVAEYLTTLPFVTIHAPTSGIIYGRNNQTERLFRKLRDLYLQIGAKNVTIHPDLVEDFSVFADQGMQFSVENNDNRKAFGQKTEEIAGYLKQNKDLGFTFDFAHAYQVNPDLVDDFLKLKDRIRQVHLSLMDNRLKEHVFLFNNQSPNLRKKLSILKEELDEYIPLVFECVALFKTDIPLLQKEIDFIHEF